jgi:hypothetical protein
LAATDETVLLSAYDIKGAFLLTPMDDGNRLFIKVPPEVVKNWVQYKPERAKWVEVMAVSTSSCRDTSMVSMKLLMLSNACYTMILLKLDSRLQRQIHACSSRRQMKDHLYCLLTLMIYFSQRLTENGNYGLRNYWKRNTHW